MSSIAEKFAHLFPDGAPKFVGPGVQRTTEFMRILALPRRAPIFDEPPPPDYFVRTDAKCGNCPVCAFGPPALRPIQYAALREAASAGGLAAPIGVGHGKTLVALLLPAVLASKNAVILVKPSLKKQLTDVDIPNYNRHFKLPLDAITVVSYNDLSSAKHADILDRLKPDLIVADEVHLLRHRSASRTMRFLRYMKEFPKTRFCALSGTMTTRTIFDYGHFFTHALKEKSPLPARYGELRDWSAAIDEGQDKYPMAPGALQLLCASGENVRDGYRRRIRETEGVVSTKESALGVSLVITKCEYTPCSVIDSALSHLRKFWSWDGEEIEDGLAFYRRARQLAQGFFYKWQWPSGEPDREWLAARAMYHKGIRDFLSHRARPGLDSALLLARAAQAGTITLPGWETWHRKYADVPPPPVLPVWISSSFVENLVGLTKEIGRKGDGVVVFYENWAVGRKIAELGGLPLFEGGKDTELIAKASPKTMPVIVCSARAHGEGRNLQAYSKMVIATPPANGTSMEQMLGRIHRSGQQADECEVHVYLHTPELRKAFAQAYSDAVYVEQTTEIKQKLLYATKVGL